MRQIQIDRDVPVPMRDGTELMADVYRPATGGQWPVLLQRTAYDKDGQQSGTMLNALHAVDAGYAVVIEDSRGRYASPGEWVPFHCEIEDGYDTVEWCAAQDWSNGRVGMYGMSYVGATQWLAAISAPPHLEAIFPVMTAADYHDGWIYRGGALTLAFTAAWTAQFLAIPHLKRLGMDADAFRNEEAAMMRSIERLRRSVSHMPLAELPLLAREGLAPYFYDWLRRADRDEGWDAISPLENHEKVTVPSFNFGGWYDLFAGGPTASYVGLREKAANQRAREGQRLLMGPWTHNTPSDASVGQRHFGYDATLVLEKLQMRWFDHWLRDGPGFEGEAPVRAYVMGEGWRDLEDWPPPGTEFVPWYLHSRGRAAGLDGDGRLSQESPGSEPPDVYLSNPANPAPTIGAAGIWDQRPAEQRGDVLVYTSEALSEPLTLLGPVSMELHASSTALDTDFVAKLCVVRPDGYAENVCDGIIRARYRYSAYHPETLEPEHPERFVIDMLATGIRVPAGHQLRIEIASACFPKYDRNPQTGEPVSTATSGTVAVQTVFHDDVRPSHVLLPVSRDGGRA